MAANSAIAAIVLEKLEELSRINRNRIRLSDTLLGDLGIIGDDISFVFVPEVERLLGRKTNTAAWKTVLTVQDAIHVFEQAISQQAVPDGHEVK